MFLTPPPLTKQQYVYDDPSGVREPAPYLRAWPVRMQRPRSVLRVNTVRTRRFAHREA
jgi:hypothetical protein